LSGSPASGMTRPHQMSCPLDLQLQYGIPKLEARNGLLTW
jgi:hypothetical protein